jgi:iron-sulfur cluster assembly accessory protein
MSITVTENAAKRVTSFLLNRGKVIIDPKSLVYLDGTELDFGKEGLNEGFKFNNPNVKNMCGCGESFNV